MATCSCEGCENRAAARGLCGKHLMRLRRHGSLEQTRPKDWGKREEHPLYSQWTGTRRWSKTGRDPEWNDFWKFVEDVGERPSIDHTMRRKDPKKPIGPDNWYWHEKKIKFSECDEYARDADGLSTNPLAVYQRISRIANKDMHKNLELLRGYGLTLDDYNRMLAEQNGVCAICKQPEKARTNGGLGVRALAVDHCHATGKVRGLLCSHCNKAIGSLQDSVEILLAAAYYLLKHQEPAMM